MIWSLLFRKILFELAKVFLLSLVGIMSILVMAGIVAEATQQGLKPGQILAVIPLLVPSFLPYTIPATTLFASCVVFGRLSRDNEILAIKAAGINIMKVVWPAVFLGLVMSCTTMGLYYQLIPYTHYLLRARVLNDVEEFLYDMLRRDLCIRRPNMPYIMWVRQVQGTRLQDALFKRFDLKNPQNGYDIIAKAREARLRVDIPHAKILVEMHHGQVLRDDGLDRLSFESRTWDVPLPPDLSGDIKPSPRALGCPQILARESTVMAREKTLAAEINERTALKTPATDPHLQDLKKHVQQEEDELHALSTELQMRPALSFGCLFFAMVGCPVGIWFSRGDYLSAFISCFLPVVFVYYPLLLCCTNQAKQGHSTLWLWAANGVIGLAGLVLFRQILRH